MASRPGESSVQAILIMLATGAVIGAGIFGAIGTAAGQVDAAGHVIRVGAGPALVRCHSSSSGSAGTSRRSAAELAAMIPQAGSAYAYSYATLGELVAWIIGWDLILEYAVGNVAVAISWATTSRRSPAAGCHYLRGQPPDTERRC